MPEFPPGHRNGAVGKKKKGEVSQERKNRKVLLAMCVSTISSGKALALTNDNSFSGWTRRPTAPPLVPLVVAPAAAVVIPDGTAA